MTTSDTIRIQPIDPGIDDPLLEAWADVFRAVSRADFGDRYVARRPHEWRAWFRVMAPDYDFSPLAAVVDGAVVGAADVWAHRLDNFDRLECNLTVLPRHRRRGVGTALVREMERLAASSGRTVIGCESESPLGEGGESAAFAERNGYESAEAFLRSELDLEPNSDFTVLEREAAVCADGYRLLTWWDEIPEQWLGDRALFGRRMSTDPPMGSVTYGEEAWDEARARRSYELHRAQGHRVVETAALHEASGRLAGYTALSVADYDPTLAHQEDTLVLAEHRGHRLGMLMKTANLRQLRDAIPTVRRVVTYNDAENAHMLRVNRAMGFWPISEGTEWQKKL